MDFTFNIYSLVLIFSGTIGLLLSYYVYKKVGTALQIFGLMMLSNAVWSLGYGFELASSSLEQIKFFIAIEYVGIASLPITWFLFCLNISGKERWYKRPLAIPALFIIPIITVLLVWTNDYHHLHYKNFYLDTSSGLTMFVVEHGISYAVFIIYFYVVLAVGNYLLFVKFRRSDRIYRRQNYMIIIGSLMPWVANMTYLLGLRPLVNLDTAPFAFMITVLFISIAIYRFKLFDILPVAREKVLDLMQDGYVVLDHQNRVLGYNLAFLKYLGNVGTLEIIGADIEELLPLQDTFTNFLKEHRSGKIELKVQTADKLFDLEADIMYLNENQLNNEATIIKLQDLTPLREEARKSRLLAEELQQLNQLKDRIFSIIAHDLRGPLVNISEVLKMISTKLITIEEFEELAPALSKDVSYTKDLLENILHWSRSQLKGYGIHKELFDLKALIVNEINYHSPSAAAKNIEIVQDVFPGEPVYADLLMMQIVVRNILNNAIKFCAEGGVVEISASYRTEHRMMLRIQDNGVGMEPVTVKKLFSGQHVSTRGTMNEKGTGLGLMVCKDFIERNDGYMIVESEVGKGTSFSMFIPIGKN